ncbi:hypothetical protein GCM10022240_08990 [Microbacterium kribbense]|uniref:Uncharacterized protein n=1 Tax=Microbacterium kribbense TaxID=433645 RepID=A0ABP7G985_9MICO
MTMHPAIGYAIVTQEIQERVRDAERRRFLKEHPDQIVRRAPGRWMRLVRRILPFRASPRSHQAPCETATAR